MGWPAPAEREKAQEDGKGWLTAKRVEACDAHPSVGSGMAGARSQEKGRGKGNRAKGRTRTVDSKESGRLWRCTFGVRPSLGTGMAGARGSCPQALARTGAPNLTFLARAEQAAALAWREPDLRQKDQREP